MGQVTRLQFTWEEVARILLRESGIESGEWEIGGQWDVAIGQVHSPNGQIYPGGTITISHINLAMVPVKTPMSITAEVQFPKAIEV